MQKFADKYFQVDPWRIVENGFDASRNCVSESIFSLGNEYMGVRGYFEEGYEGDRLLGSYFNGVYELGEDGAALHYKGIVRQTHFMINSLDWLYTRITLDGELLEASKSNIYNFSRCLNLKTGVLTRKLIWKTLSGKVVEIEFERFVSMANSKLGCQSIKFKALNFSGPIEVIMGLDFNTIHKNTGKNYWNCCEYYKGQDFICMLGKTSFTEQKLFSSARVYADKALDMDILEGEKLIEYKIKVKLEQDMEVTIHKLILNHAEKKRDVAAEEVWSSGLKSAEALQGLNYQDEKKKHVLYWEQVWNTFDISIEGDTANQQGIRYCIFQLHQTYHGEDPSLNIGAKGLTGEAYNGHTFWDTETYCLPFYIFNNPKAARNLLEYRYNTLPMALDRAKQLDCRGASYPIATLNGREACTLWQHASLQFQPSTAVAYGIFHYENITKDKEFLYSKGIEMLIQICRFLATRGDFSGKTGRYGYYGVMGPDEFQMMVNNNCYTNFMAKKTFEYTLQVLEEMKVNAEEKLRTILERLKLSEKETHTWKTMSDNMFVPIDSSTGIYEQHEGYFNLPHIDIDAIPVEDFPLYNHWSYDRIYRNDMIKQPDVLMFMFLHSQEFSLDSKKVNYEFYEPRCIHESSLSPSIHSVFATELGKHEEAFEFFKFATRMDLDNYNRNTNEGLHTTSIAAAWVNIVYGFGGLRSDGKMLKLSPVIPRLWNSYSFRILYKGSVLGITVNKDFVNIKVVDGSKVSAVIYENEVEITKEGIKMEIPLERRC